MTLIIYRSIPLWPKPVPPYVFTVIISSDFVSSKDNLEDPFTKDLSGERINHQGECG